MSCNCGCSYNNLPCCCPTVVPNPCSTTTTICPDAQPCSIVIESECIIYNGKNFTCAGITTGMTVAEVVDIIIQSLNLNCITTTSTTSTTTTSTSTTSTTTTIIPTTTSTTTSSSTTTSTTTTTTTVPTTTTSSTSTTTTTTAEPTTTSTTTSTSSTTTTTTTTASCTEYNLNNPTPTTLDYSYISCVGVDTSGTVLAGDCVDFFATTGSVLFDSGLILGEGACF